MLQLSPGVSALRSEPPTPPMARFSLLPEQSDADCQSALLLVCFSTLIGALSCGGPGRGRLSGPLRQLSIKTAGGSRLGKSECRSASTDGSEVNRERTSDCSPLKIGHRSAKRIALL